MAYKVEDTSIGNDIVISGFERGISQSPHRGTANLQNVNLATETNEVMVAFGRFQQSQIGTSSSGGTLTPNDTNHLNTSFTLTPGVWITISASTISGLSTGDYYIKSVSSAVVQISSFYNGTTTTGLGGSGTATFTLKRGVGKPIAKATEPYFDSSSVQQYRYYVLDNTGLVWVNDSADSIEWFLPDTSIAYFGSDAAPSGITVLNGWLMAFSGNKIWTKSTVNLGGTTSASTTWVQMDNAYLNSKPNSTTPHFAFRSHQGSVYYTDGSFVGKIFPNSALQANSGVNIQSYASYTASGTTGTLGTLIDGSIPYTASSDGVTSSVPAVFFTTQAGALPTGITAGKVYYINFTPSTQTFEVKLYPNGGDGSGIPYGFVLTNAPSAGATSATITPAWPYATQVISATFLLSGTETRDVTFTNGSTTISWSVALNNNQSAQLNLNASPTIVLATGASGTQYFNTFYPVGTYAGIYGTNTLMTWTSQRLNLPYGEVAKSITEIGNTILVGGISNVVYPWNQTDAVPSGLIFLPENDTQTMITVNQVAYIFAGYKGNIYITDGSVASLVEKVPDYCAGISGTPSSYIEPLFIWGDAMYLRGRVYFSIQDQTSTKDGNCGGVWSFYPTQNLPIDSDVGLALRLENQNSYAAYNGAASVLLPNENQNAVSPQYWAGWYSSVTSPLYGIDFTQTFPTTAATVETDIIPVGTVLQKKTFSQIEYKLAAPLAAGETVRLYWRRNANEAYTDLGASIVESTTSLSGYVNPNIQGMQWAQFKAVLTPLFSTSTSFVRLVELRIR